MLARDPGIPRNLSAVCAVVVLLAAVSLPAGPAHGFGLNAASAPAAGEAKDADENRNSAARRVFEEEVDRASDKLVDKAADKIEEYTIKAGKKAWGWLEKTKKFGPLAKQVAMRYGPIVAKGMRLSGPVGTTWEVAYQAGSKLIAPYIALPLMDRYYEGEWEKQQAELSREIADLGSRGEDRRQWRDRKNDFARLIAGTIAVRKLTEDGRGPWAQDAAEDSTPAADKDPWAAESPEVRFARPVAVKTAPAPVREVETGPSNYEKALNSLQGGGARSAGYKGALEKLEADRRAEQARREAEAQAARQRPAARAAEARRQQTARDAATRDAAAARERNTQRALDRPRRERREYSKRNYNNSLQQQMNRNMQMLRQTRQQQQRAYQRQKALDLQRQRQRQLEQARRQRIYQQQRERDRQTYQPTAPARRSGGSGNYQDTTCTDPNRVYSRGCSVQ